MIVVLTAVVVFVVFNRADSELTSDLSARVTTTSQPTVEVLAQAVVTSTTTVPRSTTSTTATSSTTTISVPVTTRAPTTTPPTTRPPTTTPPATTLAPTTVSPTTLPPTTLPPTTLPPTTVPPSTSSTTTTSTTVPLQGLYLHKFTGDDKGDPDDWQARVKIEVRDDSGDRVSNPLVVVAWDGASAGSDSFTANKDGKVEIRIDGLSDDRVTFTVLDIIKDGYRYQPGLNNASSSLEVKAPD